MKTGLVKRHLKAKGVISIYDMEVIEARKRQYDVV